MAKSIPLRMVLLRVPQVGLRAFQDELMVVKLDFLLWGWNWVLGRCAGEESDILFECESVHVTKEEEISFGALFKNCKSSKNGYWTRDYKDRKRKNVAMAFLQILQPHSTTYMTSWQVGFVELALAGTPIHWARILLVAAANFPD
ncbi:hypothetical protein AXG93_3932s1010 [Marchantia polymorpha subsp. ruderalis]|uniref:Uncharacterized protein n=1 Tax=Marchantia polymorpha subsp. ruderalis TaxID=1480154 RepID=A0A176VII0_MARPO|nr:hypothetical protein AXG93_3932s1010 [Marchantia polymorpha subsp. ruderalis]